MYYCTIDINIEEASHTCLVCVRFVVCVYMYVVVHVVRWYVVHTYYTTTVHVYVVPG